MIIHIKQNTSPIHIDIALKQNRNNLTPDFILDILSKTNHYANIKKILKMITLPAQNKDNTEEENYKELQKIAKEYKDVLLKVADAREHSPQNYATLRQIASAGGYLEEFNNIDKNYKIYGIKENKVIYGTKTQDFITNLGQYDILICDAPNQEVFIDQADGIKRYIIDAFSVTFARSDLTEAELKTAPNTNITFHSSYIDIHKLEIPSNSVTLEASTRVYDYDNVEAIHFNAKNVTLASTTDIRKKLYDFSRTERVYIDTPLYGIEKFIFKPDSTISMKWSSNFPEKLDFSMCKEVYLNYSDLTGVSEIKFKNEEQKNRFLTDAKSNNNIKCIYTTPNLNPEIFNTYMR